MDIQKIRLSGQPRQTDAGVKPQLQFSGNWHSEDTVKFGIKPTRKPLMANSDEGNCE